MKVRALRKFRDKQVGRIYMANDIFEVTDERMQEMNSGQFGKLVEALEPAVPPVPTVPPDDPADVVLPEQEAATSPEVPAAVIDEPDVDFAGQGEEAKTGTKPGKKTGKKA